MAGKVLVVVESPSKAKTINKYLGKNFVVEASVGHIKDLSKFKLGVNVENNFEPKYVNITGKAQIIKKLKNLATQAKSVYIATDPDREGEAIAWHIAEEVRTENENIKRVIFNEITKTGVERGISNPRDIAENVFMSQQARRVMDRLIGFQVSPFLSRAMLDKTSEALSAGRVQSVALRLICEREEVIKKFVPIEYWNINSEFSADNGKPFKAKLVAFDGSNIKNPEGSAAGANDEETKKIQASLGKMHYIKNDEQANSLVKRIHETNFSISDVTKKTIKRKPSSPFTTSLLQQEASRKLNFSNKKTMQVAQKLYEGTNVGDDGAVGLITYMRTDSVRISPDFIEATRTHILNTYGKEYLPEKPPYYTSKSTSIQDAHEAIRPTTLAYTPQYLKKYLSKDELSLYTLIYNRYLASQMDSAHLEQTTVNITGDDFTFRATGTIIKFKGFLALYDDISDTQDEKEGSAILPKSIKKGLDLSLLNTDANQSFTKPLPRFNEASLVKELDELGIGRPSTYAHIVTTLLDRTYVVIQGKAFQPTELGVSVNDVLIKNFPELFNVKFTAKMEDELDTIAEGKNTYVGVLKEFYQPFVDSLKKAESRGSDLECDVCGKAMIIRVSRKGRFLGCSDYPNCTNTKPLPKTETEKKKAAPEIAEGINCDLCGSQMLIRSSKFGKFYGCSNYPQCKGIKQIKPPIACPSCKKGNLLERFSPKSRKKFWGCSLYPDCKYITNYEPIQQKCDKCGNSTLEIRFKKVDTGFEKYLHCNECKEKYPMPSE